MARILDEFRLRLLQAESVVSYLNFFTPVIVVFYTRDIGMGYFEVALLQAIYTVVAFLLQSPAGWLADRFSAKACNISGDLVMAGAFLIYGFAHSYGGVVFAECLMGVGVALTEGADSSLMERYAVRANRKFGVVWSTVETSRKLMQAAAYLIGGWVAAHVGIRQAVAMSALTLIASAVVAWYVPDLKARQEVFALKPRLGDYIRQAAREIREGWRFALGETRWQVLGLASVISAIEATLWTYTALLLIAGVSVKWLGVAWTVSVLSEALGAYLAGGLRLGRWKFRRVRELSVASRYGVAAACFLAAACVLTWRVNAYTVWCYLGIGFARGWANAISRPLIQEATPAGNKAMVMSVYGSIANAIFIVIVLWVGAVGNTHPERQIPASLIVAPILIVAWWRLRREKA